MKWFVAGLVVFLLLGGGWYYLFIKPNALPAAAPALVSLESVTAAEEEPRVAVVAENLTVPWEIVFLPDGELLITERTGNVLLLREGITIPVAGVEHVGEGGLLGAAAHPNFTDNHYVYLYQTTRTGTGLKNQVVRYVLRDTKLELDRVIVDDIPGAQYHDGGRIVFGPDIYLYVTVGDAGNEQAVQDRTSLAGAILRYTDEGKIPSENPYQGSPIYSYGHRNPQGLAWDRRGNLWSTEHGRSGLRSGYDELNLIQPGGNYGWPDYQGDEGADGMIAPILHSGANTTWAPGSLAYLDGSLYFPGLRGETLYEAVIDGKEVTELREHLVGEYGRLRTVQVGPDGLLYITTSNRDGRGSPDKNDDRILRVNPALLQ